jgi:membrane-associated phospholipid phosphatase
MHIIALLAGFSLIMMFLESRGLATTLALSAKGDVKRETRLLAQYGQTTCTIVTAVLIWQLDRNRAVPIIKALAAAVIVTSAVATVIKRTLGRVRPKRENAGKFLGPSFRRANWRESFPSSHSASAAAYAVVLSAAYPHAALTFWVLALICGSLRYLMDSHWPSDVLGGIALGYLGGLIACRVFF